LSLRSHRGEVTGQEVRRGIEPRLDPAGPARKAIEARGFRVLADGEVLPL